MDNKSFYVHHSAFGAFSSFMLGKLHQGGGFVLSDVRPPQEDVYIGYKQDNNIKLLPFCKTDFHNAEEEFTGEVDNSKGKPTISFFEEEDITRSLNWSSDSWKAEKLSFSIITPFGKLKAPSEMTEAEKKLAFAPVIFAEITFDNRDKTSDAELIFGLEGLNRRVSQTTNEKYYGGAFQRSSGFAVAVSEEARELSRLDLLGSWGQENYENHDLGRAASLILKVPAGSIKTYIIALATYQPGIITTGIDTKFYYTDLFTSLEDVLDFGIKNADYYLKLAKERDKELKNSGLNEARQFILAHATHSYHASTQLMMDKNAAPIWIVNEGEYLMINTFDLTVDHVFYELKFHPWTVANTLDLFVERYSYKDNKGIAFTHDMGVHNGFSKEGYSSYELPNLHGCFSYMSHEELLNWLLTAGVYSLKEKDYKWLEKNINIFIEGFKSLAERDENQDGIMDCDSSRCLEGSEITTYDSLDVSLGQARNNLYLGVKSWSSYVVLGKIFKEQGLEELSLKAIEKAKAAANTIAEKFEVKDQYIPAVFEGGNTSKIIPAVEALIYPYIIGEMSAVSEEGSYGDLIKNLKKHILSILKPGICIDQVSGGWKLSSTSKNTWNSKIYLCQYVIKNVLHMDFQHEEKWDEVHARWQQVGCCDFAATDQVNSDDGRPRGSKLYPRLVTSILWLE